MNETDREPATSASGAGTSASPDQVFQRDPTRLIPDVHELRYTVQEVAHLLGMNTDIIRHAIQSGALRAERQGHDILCIHREDLLAWLDAQGAGL